MLENALRPISESTKEDIPTYSDIALAELFVERHEHELRYVASWSRWYRWDGQRWAPDETLLAFDLARRLCRDMAEQANAKDTKAKAFASSAKTVAAVAGLSRADQRLAATVEQWDQDIYLLNTPDGVVDLRTGNMRAHRREDFMTKIASVGPGQGCPLWHEFLERVTNGDAELQAYLQRLAGYAATGSVREHVLPFAYGSGANGKGTFIRAISDVLGDYAMTAPIETFAASNSDRHPTDLARLRGARLVTAQETEEGRRWAESRIKTLTGGDRIAARYMRADFFEYDPQFTLLIAGNHKPGLRSVDEAIRRRFNLIPFTVTIPPDERDPDLSERLKEEAPGILAWMIEGAVEWMESGLRPPEIVQKATDAYLAAQDAIAAWIDDECERDPAAWTNGSELYRSYKAWAERSGEHVMARARFQDALEARDVMSKRQPGTGSRGFLGLRILPPELSNDEWWNR